MKKTTKILLLLLAVFLLIQLYRPNITGQNLYAKDLEKVPPDVNEILRNSCFDCHSSATNLRWYDKITPVNFIVAADIEKGRSALNFSHWDSLPTPQQNAKLYYAINKILSGEMPLPAYTTIHPAVKPGGKEIAILKNYLVSRTPRTYTDSTQISLANEQYENWVAANNKAVSHKKVAASPNGIEYIPDYRNWKAISTTDRFDNGTMRIIFGNDIAVEAIKNHRVNLWPDGAIIAKTAWKQQLGKDGVVSTGQFLQVEFMIKDAEKYKATGGWGWARWKGDELKPYGQIGLEQECISCHLPVKKNDLVFTTPLNLSLNLYDYIKK